VKDQFKNKQGFTSCSRTSSSVAEPTHSDRARGATRCGSGSDGSDIDVRLGKNLKMSLTSKVLPFTLTAIQIIKDKKTFTIMPIFAV
jgi:hypothetical protein